MSNADDTNVAWARLIALAKSHPSRARTVDEHIRAEQRASPKVDRRTLRKTGRTEQLNVRVAAETKAEIQSIAQSEELLIGEVIEQAIAALRDKLAAQSEAVARK